MSHYPLEVYFISEVGKPPIKGRIGKLAEIGFVMRVDMLHYFKVGAMHDSEIYFHDSRVPMKAKCKVIKTYDILEKLNRDEKVKLMAVEMHFVNLEIQDKKRVLKFLGKA